MPDRPLIFEYLDAAAAAGWIARWTGPQRGYMLAFLRHVDKDGVAFVGVKALAVIIGANERNTARTRAKLIAEGYLAVHEAVAGRPTKYRLVMPPPAQRDMAQKDRGTNATPGAVSHGAEGLPMAQDGSHPRRRMVSTHGAVRHPNSNEQLFNIGGHSAGTRAASLNGKTKTDKKTANPIWDAVAEFWFSGKVPAPDQSRVGKVVAGLKAHGATPDEIHARLDRYRKAWPRAEASPEALLKHWVRFEAPKVDAIDHSTEALFFAKRNKLKNVQLTPAQEKHYANWISRQPVKEAMSA